MSYTTDIEGSVSINPPLPWSQIKDSPILPANAKAAGYWPDAYLHVIETEVDTDDGILTRRVADAIVASEYETCGRTLINDVQALIDANPDHEFTGMFECEGERRDDLWRLVVRGRRAVKVTARIVWPDGDAAQWAALLSPRARTSPAC